MKNTDRELWRHWDSNNNSKRLLRNNGNWVEKKELKNGEILRNKFLVKIEEIYEKVNNFK